MACDRDRIISSLKNFQRAGVLFVIIVVTFLVYGPALGNGFVWDDTALVLRDPLIRSWRLIPESFQHFLFLDATASNFYRPIQRLTFLMDYQMWEFSPRGYHLTSLYVHAAAAFALYLFVERLFAATGRRYLGILVALVWVIHPLHSSAITYVAGRADPLAAFFGFSALNLGLMSLDGGKRSRIAMLAAGICFLAALLSKESGLAALLIWILLLGWKRVEKRVWVQWLVVLTSVLVIYAGLRFTAESTPPPKEEPTPLAVRPILAARAWAEYTGLILAPVQLRMERDVSTKPLKTPEATLRQARLREYQTLLGILLIGAFVLWLRWCVRHLPVAAFCLAAFVCAYLPISNLFSLNATVAEHWLYVPSAFLFMAIALSLQHSLQRSSKLQIAVTILLVPWLVWLGSRTWQRQSDWKDQRTFLTRTIEAGGDSARMHVNLGQLEFSQNHYDLALRQFEEAMRIQPDQSFACLGMAAVLIRMERYDEAEAALEKAEKVPLLASECRQFRAAIFNRRTGSDSTPMLRESAELAPRYWPAWKRYFMALAKTGKRPEAIKSLITFLDQQPFRSESWKLLGDFLADEHDFVRAIAAFQESIQLDVHEAEAPVRIELIRQLHDQPGSQGNVR